MEVQIERSTIIPQANPNGDPYEIPFSIFDRYAPDYYVSVLFVFKPPTPTNSAMIYGLAKTLVHFPIMTARIGCIAGTRRPCFLAGGQGGGALVVEAVAAGRLEEHLPLEQGPGLLVLHPSWKDKKVHTMVRDIGRYRYDMADISVILTCPRRY